LFLLEPAEKVQFQFPTSRRADHHTFSTKFTKISSSSPPAKKAKTVETDGLKLVQKESNSSHNRRERAYLSGHAKGLDEGKKSAALDCAVLRATNEALHLRLGQLLEQSNGCATGQLIATETAANLVLENQQLKNKVASLEHIITSHEDELANTKQISEEQARELAATKQNIEDQARELAALRDSRAQFLGLHCHTSSAQRHSGSVYIKRTNLPPN
jgi:chromosome segregation ATPase